MSLSSRIEVENRIFSRASELKAEVYAKQGGLFSTADDLELQSLLYIYNAHFRAENLQQYTSAQEELSAYKAYKPCLRSGLGIVYWCGAPKSIRFEIIMGNNNEDN